MDTNLTPVDGNQLQTLKANLLEGLLDAMEKNDISVKDIRPIARTLLSQIGKAKTYEDLVDYLKNAKVNWPFINNALQKFKEKEDKVSEQQVIDRLSTYIKNTA